MSRVSGLSRVAKTELQIYQKLCQEIGSTRALTGFLLAKYGEYEQLLALEIDHELYDDPSAFADDYLVTKVLSKSMAVPTSYDKEKVAYDKWIQAEDLCRSTNERLKAYRDRPITDWPARDRIVNLAIDFCHEALGPLTRGTLNRVSEEMGFSDGATTAVRRVVTRGRKFSAREVTTTSELLSWGLFCMPDLWKRRLNPHKKHVCEEGSLENRVTGFQVVEHNQLSFVPKNAKTHRAITVENDLNIFVQRGIGKVVRQKLANIGLHLDTQWRVNQALAARASFDALATIDLSSASDTISRELVRLFVPDDWYELMDWARPKYSAYKRDGEVITHKLEKFSGMGNGFTFELETLIFYCVLKAAKVVNSSVAPISAFGDDMICGVDILKDVCEALDFLGLKVNSDKSFGKTTFHESCGADYFKGVNVRPFFLKAEQTTYEDHQFLYLYCNNIRRYANRRNGGYSCDSRFLPAWLCCYCSISPTARVFVPSFDYATNGVVGNWDEAQPSIRWAAAQRGALATNGWSGWLFSGYFRKQVETQQFREGAYVGSLTGVSTDAFTYGRESVRGRVKRGYYKECYTVSWCDLGPWL